MGSFSMDTGPGLKHKADAELIFEAAMAEKSMQANHGLEGSRIVIIADKGYRLYRLAVEWDDHTSCINLEEPQVTQPNQD